MYMLSPKSMTNILTLLLQIYGFDDQCNKKINAVGRNDDHSMSLA